MQRNVRLLIVTILTIFIAGVGVQTASSATMEFVMAMSDDAAEKMPFCGACDEEGEQTQCDVDCTTVSATLHQEAQSITTTLTAHQIAIRSDLFVRRSGPPDPYPPKFPILLS
jgi:hypothetical protein